ncbi:hypothetical protein BD310DRAFT_812828, partial [Dichomitus squalens]
EPMNTLYGRHTSPGDMTPEVASENPPCEQLPATSEMAQTLAENARLKAMLRNHGITIHLIPTATGIPHLPLGRAAAADERLHPDISACQNVPNWSSVCAPPLDRTASFPERNANGQVLVLPRREQDYPRAAKFWTKRKYEAWIKSDDFTVPGAIKGRQGPGRLKLANENVNVQFVVDAHGNVIDGDRAAAIRAEMRTWLRGRDHLLESWKGGATLQMKAELYAHMYTRFPELQLNDFDWKVEQIAIDLFSQFAAAVRRKTKSMKKKPSKKAKKHARESDGDIPCSSHGPVDLDDTFYQISGQSEDHVPPSVSLSSCVAIDSVFIQSLPSHMMREPDVISVRMSSETPTMSSSSQHPRQSDHVRGSSTSAIFSCSQPKDSAPTSMPDAIADACAAINTSRSEPNNEPEGVAAPTDSRGSSSEPNDPMVTRDADSGDGNSGDHRDSSLNIPNPLAGMWPASGPGPESPPKSRSPSAVPDLRSSAARKTLSAKPSKMDTQARVWPPTPSKTKPKDQCARIWKDRHPDGTEAEFDKYYKESIPTQNLRNKYVRNNGDLTAVSGRKRGTGSNGVRSMLNLSIYARLISQPHLQDD